MTLGSSTGLRDQVTHVNAGIPDGGLYGDARLMKDGSKVPWRLSPEPLTVSASAARTLEELGQHRFHPAGTALLELNLRHIGELSVRNAHYAFL